MTHEEIAYLRALLEKATPGPWILHDQIHAICSVSALDVSVAELMHEKDAVLIASAVNALPRLLDRVESLQEMALEYLSYVSQTAESEAKNRAVIIEHQKLHESLGAAYKKRIDHLKMSHFADMWEAIGWIHFMDLMVKDREYCEEQEYKRSERLLREQKAEYEARIDRIYDRLSDAREGAYVAWLQRFGDAWFGIGTAHLHLTAFSRAQSLGGSL